MRSSSSQKRPVVDIEPVTAKADSFTAAPDADAPDADADKCLAGFWRRYESLG